MAIDPLTYTVRSSLRDSAVKIDRSAIIAQRSYTTSTMSGDRVGGGGFVLTRATVAHRVCNPKLLG
jgi:hypothetical protein